MWNVALTVFVSIVCVALSFHASRLANATLAQAVLMVFVFPLTDNVVTWRLALLVIALMVFAPLVKIIIQTQTNNVALTVNARQGSLVFPGFAKTTKAIKITTMT